MPRGRRPPRPGYRLLVEKWDGHVETVPVQVYHVAGVGWVAESDQWGAIGRTRRKLALAEVTVERAFGRRKVTLVGPWSNTILIVYGNESDRGILERIEHEVEAGPPWFGGTQDETG